MDNLKNVYKNTFADTPKAVVSGGGSGIGKSIAQKLADIGFTVGVGDLKHSDDALFSSFLIDFTQPKQVYSFYKEVMASIGTPNVLVFNAGRGIHEKLTEGNPDTWEDIFHLNILSVLRMIRFFVPEMLKQERGDIVFISSVAARHAYTYGGIYAATKAALDIVAETLRLELQPIIRVTTVHPGVVDSDFFKNMVSGSHTPEDIGWGVLKPEQVADAVVYAVCQPPGVVLNDIVIRPIAQPM